MTKTNLNPQNLDDINNALKLDHAEQLWFFLDDSIPTENRNETLLLNDTNWMSQTSMLTDMCYAAEDKNALRSFGLEGMEPYIPFLKSCYLPYYYMVNTCTETEKQKKMLKKLSADKRCIASLKKSSEFDVPATITLDYSGKHILENVFLRQCESMAVSLDKINEIQPTVRCTDKKEALEIIESAGYTGSDLSSNGIGYISTIKKNFPEMMKYISDIEDTWDGGYTSGDPFLLFLSEELLKDRDIVTALLKNGHLEYDSDIVKPTGMLDERETAVWIAGQNSGLIDSVNEEFLNDNDFIAETFKYGNCMLYHLTDEQKKDNKIRLSVLTYFGTYELQSLFKNGKYETFLKRKDANTARIAYLCGVSYEAAEKLLSDNTPAGKEIITDKIIKTLMSDRYIRPEDIPDELFENKELITALMLVSNEFLIPEIFAKAGENLRKDNKFVETACKCAGHNVLKLLGSIPKDEIYTWYNNAWSNIKCGISAYDIPDDIEKYIRDIKVLENLPERIAECGYILPGFSNDSKLIENTAYRNPDALDTIPIENISHDTIMTTIKHSNNTHDIQRLHRLWNNYLKTHPEDETAAVKILYKTMDLYSLPTEALTKNLIAEARRIDNEMVEETKENMLRWANDESRDKLSKLFAK